MEFKDSYLGNPLVKRDGVETTFTKEQMVEYAKCMQSPAYFAETYIKIISLDRGLIPFKLYDYQRDMFKHFTANRFNIVLACRQSGKSISSVAYLLWYAIFHPEKTVFILANKHATAKEMLARLTLMLENIPFWLQPGCKGLNKTDAHFSNNSKIIAASTSSNSIRGMTANLIFLDEFAFVEKAAQFYTSTYPVISSGESSRVIITSTANGIGNQYHKIWEGAKQRTNSYVPFQIDWWNVPGRDETWKEETVANTSQLQFDQEFGNCIGQQSKVTIELNKKYFNIEIGSLYEIIKRNGSLGFTIEEEISNCSDTIKDIWITYKIVNKTTAKYYIGKTCLRIWEKGYMGSGFAITEAVRKYDKNSWERKILSYHINESDAYIAEEVLLRDLLEDKLCYNIAGGGKGVGSGENHPNYGRVWSEETNKKRSLSLRGQLRTKEQIENYKKAWTTERRSIQSALISSKPGTMLGKKHSEETKKKISDGSKGEKNGFYGKKHKTSVCPHCFKVGSTMNMSRWHFDNCKGRPK